jgi:hypothetical protein
MSKEHDATDKAIDRQAETLEDLRDALNRDWYVSTDDSSSERYRDDSSSERYRHHVYDEMMEAFETAIDAYFAVSDALEAEERAKGRAKRVSRAAPHRHLSLVGKLPRPKEGSKEIMLPEGPYTPAPGDGEK